jgi:hypothetical protein
MGITPLSAVKNGEKNRRIPEYVLTTCGGDVYLPSDDRYFQ